MWMSLALKVKRKLFKRPLKTIENLGKPLKNIGKHRKTMEKLSENLLKRDGKSTLLELIVEALGVRGTSSKCSRSTSSRISRRRAEEASRSRR